MQKMLLSILLIFFSSVCFAQEIHFLSTPAGYKAGSISLPRGFAGALAADPSDSNVMYAALGEYGHNSLARINLQTQQVTIIADDKFGALNGIAVINSEKIVCIDNLGSNAGMPNDTILLASDDNHDKDFNDAGEIAELIAPIQADSPGFGFTGAQARIAPAGNVCNIPAGSVLVQTADGNGKAELLAIMNPLTAPAYYPAGGPFFSGFDYNGGFDFDRQGRLILGEQTSFLGGIHAFSDATNHHAMGSNEMYLSDLIVDAENDVMFCAASQGFEAIRTLHIPNNPMTGTATVSDFAITDSSYLTAIMLSSKTRQFTANGGFNGAVLVTGGFMPDYSTSRNLLTLTPKGFSGSQNWVSYK